LHELLMLPNAHLRTKKYLHAEHTVPIEVRVA
jgi:hypothetical protein